MSSDLLALIVVILIVIFAVIGVIHLIFHPRTRNIAGSMTTSVFGATDGFMTKDKKAAIEIMTEVKAKKKMEEQSSKEPKDKNKKAEIKVKPE